MESRFENTTEYTKPVMMEATRRHLRYFNRVRNVATLAISAVVILAMVVGIIGYFAVGKGVLPATALLIVGMLLLFCVWTMEGYRLTVRRNLAEMRGKVSDIKYAFADTGFVGIDGRGESRMPWDMCTGYLLTENLCIILQRQGYHIVDLRGFTKGTREDFLKYLAGFLPEKGAPKEKA